MKSLRLFSKIALIATQNSEFEVEMNEILEAIGEHTGFSRVYIFMENEEKTEISNTFEWCNTGIKSQIDNLKNISYESIPSFGNIILNEKELYCDDVMNLPEDIKKFIIPQEIKSIIIHPIKFSGVIRGFIGFDECLIKRKWDKTDKSLIATLSGIISNLYEKEYIMVKMKEDKIKFESFINTIDDFIIICNRRGEILFANKSVMDIFGYTEEDLLKMNVIDLRPYEQRDEVIKIFKEILEKKRNTCPIDLVTKMGVRIPVETRVWEGTWYNKKCFFSISKNLSKEQEALQKFTMLFDSNPALMSVATMPERKFINVNESFLNTLGYSMDEVIGKDSKELDLYVNPDDRDKLTKELEKKDRIPSMEMRIKRKNGRVIEGLLSGEVINIKGENYFLTVMVDITKQKYVQAMYEEEKIRLNSIIDGTRLGTWEWNIKTGETKFNERWAEIIGYTLEELEPISIKTWEKYSHPEDLKESERLLEKHFNGETEYYAVECRMKHKNGEWVWVEDRGKVIEWDEDGKPMMMYGTHTDVTEKKEIEKMIIDISNRDHLTGVYNRRYIFDRIEKDLERFDRKEVTFSISILDIDFFKRINDTYGHLAGDYILKEFTRTIGENLREYDLLGRFGGEEFIVIMFDTNKEDSAGIIERIRETVREKTYIYNDNKINFTFSAGISDVHEFDHKDIRIEEIISLADKRLYIAKAEGRNRVIVH